MNQIIFDDHELLDFLYPDMVDNTLYTFPIGWLASDCGYCVHAPLDDVFYRKDGKYWSVGYMKDGLLYLER